VNLNGNYTGYNIQALTNISGNFRKISGNIKFTEILNFRKIYNPSAHNAEVASSRHAGLHHSTKPVAS